LHRSLRRSLGRCSYFLLSVSGSGDFPPPPAVYRLYRAGTIRLESRRVPAISPARL
jgi:hypothetical protein